MSQEQVRYSLYNHKEVPLIKVFKREYFDEQTKVKSTWLFDLDKNPNGPYDVKIEYPEGYKSEMDDVKSSNKNLPISQQKFLNPANGKYVGYCRAIQLGLVKPTGDGRGRPKKA